MQRSVKDVVKAIFRFQGGFVKSTDEEAASSLTTCIEKVFDKGAEFVKSHLNAKFALMELFESTGGANWINKTNWGTNKLLHEWHGVTTNHDGEVTGLNLAENNLVGAIPNSMGLLSSVSTIDLSNNALTGVIPDSLGGLTHLKYLWLQNNGLLGLLPSSISSNASLIMCGLSGNMNGPSSYISVEATNRDMLLDFFISTNGAKWFRSDNWCSDRPLSEWFGVCTHAKDEQSIEQLDLHKNNLTGFTLQYIVTICDCVN